ncbi:hypothetical protein [Planctomyces sp. SH-PL14]|uniref:hypothetical protein n=1 Tax=Planctomyces sp. SH-PL14 TaxID=1632864 RepID=UPI00078C92D5|nr:hypothetical protein [Planctomyces sp. SH-PL14]AMV16472.1 hypothetical protein VT03_01190 [Planctomyces sp. SH-PL14]
MYESTYPATVAIPEDRNVIWLARCAHEKGAKRNLLHYVALNHKGEYLLRNDTGADKEGPLSPGRLTPERYKTFTFLMDGTEIELSFKLVKPGEFQCHWSFGTEPTSASIVASSKEQAIERATQNGFKKISQVEKVRDGEYRVSGLTQRRKSQPTRQELLDKFADNRIEREVADEEAVELAKKGYEFVGDYNTGSLDFNGQKVKIGALTCNGKLSYKTAEEASEYLAAALKKDKDTLSPKQSNNFVPTSRFKLVEGKLFVLMMFDTSTSNYQWIAVDASGKYRYVNDAEGDTGTFEEGKSVRQDVKIGGRTLRMGVRSFGKGDFGYSLAFP